MNLKDIKKAAQILSKIEDLDKQIIQIQKIAISITNSETKSVFSFSIQTTDIRKQQEQSNEIHFDSDGSLIFGRPRNHGQGFMGIWQQMNHFNPIALTDSNTEKLNFDISENETLMLLEVMVNKKIFERDLLLEQLKQYGYSH